MKDVIFKSDRLNFVKVDIKYVDDYLVMVNDPVIQDFIFIEPITFSYDDEVKWVKMKLDNNDPVYTVIDRESGKFVGTVEFKDVKERSSEIGICITPSFQDKHYGTEILKKVLDYGFNDFGLDEIFLKVFSHNVRAIHCYKNVGFIEYDVVKDVKKSNGLDVDEIYMKVKKI